MFGNMTALEGLHATLRVPASFGLEPRTTHVNTLDDESAKGQQSTGVPRPYETAHPSKTPLGP